MIDIHDGKAEALGLRRQKRRRTDHQQHKGDLRHERVVKRHHDEKRRKHKRIALPHHDRVEQGGIPHGQQSEQQDRQGRAVTPPRRPFHDGRDHGKRRMQQQRGTGRLRQKGVPLRNGDEEEKREQRGKVHPHQHTQAGPVLRVDLVYIVDKNALTIRMLSLSLRSIAPPRSAANNA